MNGERLLAIALWSACLISCGGSSASAQDDAGAWSELARAVEEHSPIGLVRVDSRSRQFILNEETGELEEIIRSRMEATFGASAGYPSWIRYRYRKSRWTEGSSPYYGSRKEHVFGPDYFAVIRHESGGIDGLDDDLDDLVDRSSVKIYSEPPHPDISNRLEVGDGFLLLRQRVFREISLTSLVEQGDEFRESVGLVAGKQRVEGEECLVFTFSRQHRGWLEKDRLFLSQDRALALVKRELTRVPDDELAKALEEIGRQPSPPFTFTYDISDWAKIGDSFLGRNYTYGLSIGGKAQGRIETAFTNLERADPEELAFTELQIPKGYRVKDYRTGVTDEADEEP